MITGINESKTLKTDISCEWKCNLDGKNIIQSIAAIMINVDVSKKCHVCEKDFVNPPTCNCENGKNSASVMDDLVITRDETIESTSEETKTITTNFNEKKATGKMQNFYILLAFLLITIAL